MALKLSSAEARKHGLAAKRKRGKAKSGPTMMQVAMIEGCKQRGLPSPSCEVKFHDRRWWRWDFAWWIPTEHEGTRKVALEVQGGIWTGGAHSTGVGQSRDIEKHNEAVAWGGWIVLYCTPSDVESGRVFELLKRVL